MNHDTNSLNSVHDGIVGILDHIQQYHGRAAAQRLLSRIQNTFDNGGSSSITAEGKGTVRELPGQSGARADYNEFLEKGGYSLIDQNIYLELENGTYQVLAFGIVAATNQSPTFAFLLRLDRSLCYQVELTLSDLGHFSSVRHPLFGNNPTFTFLKTQSVHSHVDVPKLIRALNEYGVKELADAVAKVQHYQVKVTDDVPQATLVPLTDYERDTLPAIPNVEFWYGDRGEELIRIEPVGRDGYAFFTRHQAVEVNARNVDVSKRLAPGLVDVWTLQVTPHARHEGVSLHAVMSLTEDDPRRAEYLPLIDIFIAQTLEHAQRQPKQQ